MGSLRDYLKWGDAGIFSQPMARGGVIPTGMDEIGNPVYSERGGNRQWTMQQQNPPATAPKETRSFLDVWKQDHSNTTPLAAALSKAPAVANVMTSGFQAPGKALAGEDTTLGDVYDTAFSTALGAGVGRGAIGAEQGGGVTLNSLAGIGSLTADRKALKTAEYMEKSGYTPKDITQATGWHRLQNGAWAYEISDADAKFKNWPISHKAQTLGDVFDHPNLFKAYPDMANVPLKNIRNWRNNISGLNGYYQPKTPSSILGRKLPRNELIAVNAKRGWTAKGRKKAMEDAMDIVIHEGQHRIENVERFPSGSSPEIMADFLHDPALKGVSRNNAYFWTAGEVNARLATARRKLTAHELRFKHTLDPNQAGSPYQYENDFNGSIVPSTQAVDASIAGKNIRKLKNIVKWGRTPANLNTEEAYQNYLANHEKYLGAK